MIPHISETEPTPNNKLLREKDGFTITEDEFYLEIEQQRDPFETKIRHYKKSQPGQPEWIVKTTDPQTNDQYRFTVTKDPYDRTERLALYKTNVGASQEVEIFGTTTNPTPGRTIEQLRFADIQDIINSGVISGLSNIRNRQKMDTLEDHIQKTDTPGKNELQTWYNARCSLISKCQPIINVYDRIKTVQGELSQLPPEHQEMLIYARTIEDKLRTGTVGNKHVDLRWLATETPWYWDLSDHIPFPHAIGIVVSEHARGEVEALGSTFAGIEGLEQNPFVLYEHNIDESAQTILDADVEISREALHERGWLESALSEGRTEGLQEAGKRIRKMVAERCRQQEIDFRKDMSNKVVAHEGRHNYDRVRGDEPQFEEPAYSRTQFVAHEAVAYLCELTPSKDPIITILNRLGTPAFLSAFAKVKLQEGGGDFWHDINRHIDHPSMIGGLIAADFVLRKLLGTSLEELSLSTLENAIYQLYEIDLDNMKPFYGPMRGAILKYNEHAASPEQKKVWLMEHVGFDIDKLLAYGGGDKYRGG